MGFKLNGKMKFINISQEYVRKLNEACSEVYYRPAGYDSKPYIGILINKEGQSYVIPLTSAKDKHKTWKNINQECFFVYEYAEKVKMGESDIWVQENEESTVVKHIMSMIDVKKMVPIKEGVYTIVDMNKSDEDTEEVIKYKDLLNKEYSFCLKILDDLMCKANRVYDQQMRTGRVKKFCCDFKILEAVCNTYRVKII